MGIEFGVCRMTEGLELVWEEAFVSLGAFLGAAVEFSAAAFTYPRPQ